MASKRLFFYIRGNSPLFSTVLGDGSDLKIIKCVRGQVIARLKGFRMTFSIRPFATSFSQGCENEDSSKILNGIRGQVVASLRVLRKLFPIAYMTYPPPTKKVQKS